MGQVLPIPRTGTYARGEARETPRSLGPVAYDEDAYRMCGRTGRKLPGSPRPAIRCESSNRMSSLTCGLATVVSRTGTMLIALERGDQMIEKKPQVWSGKAHL